jgi:hypothetical protein
MSQSNKGLIMKNITQHTGTLEVLSRLPSSINGNPRYLLRVDGHTCKTPVDSMYGYSVTNFDGKQVQASIGTHYGSATLNSLKGA